jgi:hypothetical protein
MRAVASVEDCYKGRAVPYDWAPWSLARALLWRSGLRAQNGPQAHTLFSVSNGGALDVVLSVLRRICISVRVYALAPMRTAVASIMGTAQGHNAITPARSRAQSANSASTAVASRH